MKCPPADGCRGTAGSLGDRAIAKERGGRERAVRVEQLRGGWVEAVHDVHVVVVDSAGTLVARAGDPELVTFWRSAAKPFQALPLIEDGAAERFGLTSEELALACASHSSEPKQVARVRELLGKIGCSERDLLCGPHPPLSDRVAQDYQTRGVRLTAVYSNCSGKHAGMLALARHHGWPTEFRSEEHTSELQSQSNLVCRLLLEKKKKRTPQHTR